MIHALSPLDGRYAQSTAVLAPIFSEYGLIRARLRVEIFWLLALDRHRALPHIVALSEGAKIKVLQWWEKFSHEDAQAVKTFEAETNHDVKALEYWMQAQCRASGEQTLIRAIPALHFALTSEDINNLAINTQVREGWRVLQSLAIDQVLAQLIQMAKATATVPMLARTHGQSATPVTMGKEMAVFVDRLHKARERVNAVQLTGKLNGATGGFNAHVIAAPNVAWPAIANEVIRDLGFVPNAYTTQIEPHDRLAELCQQMMVQNTIALDLARDIWQYIAMDYYTLKVVGKEVGSSTMPHKVNPIDFENAEGNLGIANALLSHFAQKLPISRLQRDLSDSTVQRNIGVAFGHTLLAWQSLLKGLLKLTPNPQKMLADLDANWEVLTEALQTALRAEGHDNAYDVLKKASRGVRLSPSGYRELLESLPLSTATKTRLAELTPAQYLGINAKLAESLSPSS